MSLFIQVPLGFCLAALIGVLAYRRGSLSKSGVAGALLVGTLLFGLGGWGPGVLLVTFFVSSTVLSHYKESLKESLSEKFSKGHRRDLAQTLANGGAAALLVLANLAWPHPLWGAALAGALATVNADTWATELGVLSRTRPRHILTGQPVETGTSGGVTLVGTLAALAGAALIAAVACTFSLLLGQPFSLSFLFFLSATFAGLLGSLFDSLLGATAQAIYYCDHCQKETERYPAHTCGHPTRQIRGWRWLDNDWVNFLASVCGAALAAGLWRYLAG
jgi:uncharacterized protein (TIGR00297 family)